MGTLIHSRDAGAPRAARTLNAGDRRFDSTPATPEGIWCAWIAQQELSALDVAQCLQGRARLVMVAPHPDDEILAAAGLMTAAARLGVPVKLIAVTDGTASHPGSTLWPVERLARHRPQESARALAHLGVPAEERRLGFGDGMLAASVSEVSDAIGTAIRPDDLVVTTWRLDGHPDHEATGEACDAAVRKVGACLIEAPVWAWQWGRPGDPRWPWERARTLRLQAETVQKKALALTAFESQLAADLSTGNEPVLCSAIVQRASRDFELFFL